MDCPKCGMPDAQTGGAVACPRCGVIFAKLQTAAGKREKEPARGPGPGRPAGPSRPASYRAPSRPRGSRIIELVGLGAVAVGALLWFAPERDPEESPNGPSASAASDSASASPSPSLPAPDSGASPSPGGASSAVATPMPTVVTRSVTLPELTPATINEQVLNEAIELAHEDPENEPLQRYVARAYLILADKASEDGGTQRALQYLDGAEAWGAPERLVVIERATIYGGLERWSDAARWGERAIELGTRDAAEMAEMYYFVGKAHYDRGDFQGAAEAFRAAIRIRDDRRYRMALETTSRVATRSSADEKRLSHFYVTYQGGTMEMTGRMVIDSLERSHASLVSRLGFEPPEPVAVILYTRRQYTEMGGPHWSAGFFDGRIHVPIRGLSRVDPQLSTTLHHELAHAFVSSKAGPGAPRWLQEGVAQYVEGMDSQRAGPMLASVLEREGTLEACVLATRCDVRVFYPSAASFVDYLIQLRGMGGVRDVIEELSRGNDMDTALRKVLGKDQRTLVREWEHFVKRRHG